MLTSHETFCTSSGPNGYLIEWLMKSATMWVVTLILNFFLFFDVGFLPYGSALDEVGEGFFNFQYTFNIPRISGNITLFGQIYENPRLFVS